MIKKLTSIIWDMVAIVIGLIAGVVIKGFM
jgi:hypothetical protein